MESTGDYWKSVWHRLEDSLTLVLAIATAVRNLPGHKSDVSDAQWLADLLAHGLVRGSFVPPAPIQALRELTRPRKQLGREVTAHSQRIEKVLESADVKLAAVLRPLLGVSGRAIIAALAAGEPDPDRLVALAHPPLAREGGRAAGRVARTGPAASSRLAARAPAGGRDSAATTAELDAAIGAALAPYRAAVGAPRDESRREHDGGADPGRGDRHGHDPLPQRGASHFLGGPLSTPGRERGEAPLHPTSQRSTVAQAPPHSGRLARVRGRDGYLRAQFLRLKPRRGPMKAIVAVAASMLTAAYYMLRDGEEYHGLWAAHFQRGDHARLVTGLTRRLHHLGYEVTLRRTG
jgi:hypothetical protein